MTDADRASAPVGRTILVDDAGLPSSVHGRDETAIRSLDAHPVFARTLADPLRQSLAAVVGPFSQPVVR